MGSFAKVITIATILFAVHSSASLQDETSLLQHKQTHKAGWNHLSKPQWNQKAAEAVATVAEAKMEYKRSLIEQELVLESYATMELWAEGGIANGKDDLKKIEKGRSIAEAAADRKEKSLKAIWKDGLSKLLQTAGSDAKDKNAMAEQKKKAELHAEKAMVHQLAQEFLAATKHRAKSGQALANKVTAADMLIDTGLEMRSNANMELFEQKANSQIAGEDDAAPKKAKHVKKAKHSEKKVKPVKKVKAKAAPAAPAPPPAPVPAPVPAPPAPAAPEAPVAPAAPAQTPTLGLDKTGAVLLQEHAYRGEVPGTPKGKSDKDLAIESMFSIGALADEARRSFYGESAEARLKLASSKMMFKKALIERKLTAKDYDTAELMSKKKIKAFTTYLHMAEKNRDAQLPTAQKKSALAKAAWKAAAAKLAHTETSDEMIAAAEQAASHVIMLKLGDQQKTAYKGVLGIRSQAENEAKKQVELNEKSMTESWTNNWKSVVDDANNKVLGQESLFLKDAGAKMEPVKGDAKEVKNLEDNLLSKGESKEKVEKGTKSDDLLAEGDSKEETDTK